MTSPTGTGIVTPFNPTTGNSLLNPLIVNGFKWGNTGVGTAATVTYSFPTSNASWSSDYQVYLDNEPFNGFTPFSGAQQSAALSALASWAEVANITFQQLDDVPGDSDVGDIRFGNSLSVTNSTAAAWAYFPFDGFDSFEYPEAGDVWFDANYAPNLQLAPGQFGYSTMVHEIGHALGLDHPFADVAGEVALPPSLDNQRYSIMSYTLYSGATIEAAAPMLLDILAIQYLYGANMTTRAGDTSYQFSNSTEEFKCIWDAGGHDTFDLSNQTIAAIIDLRAGNFSSIGRKNNGTAANGNIGIAYNVTIEDAIGTDFNDKITGNEANNRLFGGKGNDTVDGGAGNDTFDGGVGNDTLIGGLGNDIFLVDGSDTISETMTLAQGGGIDTAVAGINTSIATFANVDNVLLTGAANVNATGNGLHNVLSGNGGNNILDGGTGADLMWGGAGNDTYVVDNVGDSIDEKGNTDTNDTVRTFIALNLGLLAGGNDIENATLLGTAALGLTGNALANILTGNDGANTLDGAGGADTLQGGKGNDNYIVDAGDVLVESLTIAQGGGIDTAISAGSFSIAAFANVENILLTGKDNVNATGNSGNNTLQGNAGSNWLDGGTGNDVLIGGKGNDVYMVDTLSDVISETVTNAQGGGVDTVVSAISYSIAALANVDNILLIGSADINATGNAGKNVLVGNSGMNQLDGGAGVDVLYGGAGNDTYVLDQIGDIVDEQGNADGGDTVRAAFTVNLSALAAGLIENAVLLGSASINATGNVASNILTGNDGANILDGLGGADIMSGGKGSDIYVVDNASDVVNETLTNAQGGGIDAVVSSFGFNLATYANVENVLLTGMTAANATGNAANNALVGNEGANVLDGASGIDTLIGNGGADTLIGGIGADALTGGGGRDTFDYNHLSDAGDTITDFVLGAAGDILNLADLLDDIGYGGANAFADGILSFTGSGANTLVRVDADGAGAGAAITLATLTNVALSQADTDNYVV